MNIIFDESLQNLPDSYTILELDSFRMPPEGRVITAFCVVEKIALQEFAILENLRQLHNDVIANYRKQHWNYCEQVISQQLMGKWNGDLDSFYENLLERIQKYKNMPKDPLWTHIIDKTVTACAD